jgi:peptidoglycan/xylan/chitin deacetylase (PgdA/CDA1 family)
MVPPHAVILTYHSAVVRTAGFPVWQHNSAAQLEAHFAWIAAHAHCVSLDELVDDLARRRLRPGTVAITFDDGYANNLHVALPLLERFRLPATFFVAAGYIGSGRLIWTETLASIIDAAPAVEAKFGNVPVRLADPAQRSQSYRLLVRHMRKVEAAQRDVELARLAAALGVVAADAVDSAFGKQLQMMSWGELRQLAASPYATIGAHTMTHPWLIDLPDDDAREEIRQSRQVLQEHAGPIEHFAYPFGGPDDFGAQHRAMAVDAGYKALFTAIPECVTLRSDPLAVPRWGIGSNTSVADVEYALTGGLAVQQGLKRWS